MNSVIGNRTAVIEVLNSINKGSEKNDEYIEFNYIPSINKKRGGITISKNYLKNLIAIRFNLDNSDIDNAIDDLKTDGILKDVPEKHDGEYLAYNSEASFSSSDFDGLRRLF